MSKRAWVVLGFSVFFMVFAVVFAGFAIYYAVTSNETMPRYPFSYQVLEDGSILIYNSTDESVSLDLHIEYYTESGDYRTENYMLTIPENSEDTVILLNECSHLNLVQYYDYENELFLGMYIYTETINHFTYAVQMFVLAMSAFILISLWFALWFSIHVSKAKVKLGNSTEEIISEK